MMMTVMIMIMVMMMIRPTIEFMLQSDTKKLIQAPAFYLKEGRTGEVSGTIHGRKKKRITDHGY